MKILSNSTDHLIIDNRPWLLGLLFVGLVLLLVGCSFVAFNSDEAPAGYGLLGGAVVILVISMVFVVRTKVYFDRPHGVVQIRRRTVRGTTTRQFDLSQVRAADVQTSIGDGSDTYRLALVLTDRTEPVTKVYTSGSAAHRAAQTINQWLAVDSTRRPD